RADRLPRAAGVDLRQGRRLLRPYETDRGERRPDDQEDGKQWRPGVWGGGAGELHAELRRARRLASLCKGGQRLHGRRNGYQYVPLGSGLELPLIWALLYGGPALIGFHKHRKATGRIGFQ